jgi:hypothetical protein
LLGYVDVEGATFREFFAMYPKPTGRNRGAIAYVSAAFQFCGREDDRCYGEFLANERELDAYLGWFRQADRRDSVYLLAGRGEAYQRAVWQVLGHTGRPPVWGWGFPPVWETYAYVVRIPIEAESVENLKARHVSHVIGSWS